MFSSPSLAQPAYMKIITSTVTGISSSSYPQPNGYQVSVVSTDAKISSYNDQIINGNKTTSITFSQ